MAEFSGENVLQGTPLVERIPHWNKIMAGLAAASILQAGLTYEEGHQEAAAQRADAGQLQQLERQLQDRDRELQRIIPGLARLTGLTPDELAGTDLEDPVGLPGTASTPVSAADAELMRQSSVKIYRHYKYDPLFSWGADCSGQLISDGGAMYALTARHCFNPLPKIKGALNGSTSDTGAAGITYYDPNEYTVIPAAEAGHIPSSVSTEPEGAQAEDIAVSTNGDWALLRLQVQGTPLEKLPAIPFREHQISPPRVGSPVVAYSLPQSSGGAQVRGEGEYLGRTRDPDNPEITMDVVGLSNADKPGNDACDYGASGSSAIMSGGYVTGPLSFRNNTHYPPRAPVEPSDPAVAELRERLILENQLKIDTSRFTTLCGYTANDRPAILTTLEDGFANQLPVPQYSYGGK